LTAVGSTPLTYDFKGNLTTNTNNHTYSWDFDNRLSGADTDGNSVDDVLYEYDALGRRVRKNNGTTNTVFVLAGWQVIAEYASGTAPASPSEQYVYASYIDEPILKTGTGGSVYYSRNRQYSITTLTDTIGLPVERYAYDSHGKLAIFDGVASPIAATQYANPYTYTGRRREVETDLYYFRARYFDSALGRFIGRDPIGYVDGMSLYRGYFVPRGVDPTGNGYWECVGITLAAEAALGLCVGGNVCFAIACGKACLSANPACIVCAGVYFNANPVGKMCQPFLDAIAWGSRKRCW